MFGWNDVDTLFIFDFELDLHFNFSQKTDVLNIMPLTGATSYSAYILEPLQLNFDNDRSVWLE